MFETLLVRSVSPHLEIFDRVGRAASRQGLISCSAYAFARARETSNRRARACRGGKVSFQDIYDEVSIALGLSPAIAAQIMDLEMAEEARVLCPVESARPLMARARAAGGGIVFVSDMYLPAAFIREQLERHGFWEPGDRLYVSHEHGCDKRSGHLFHVVAATEGVRPADIVHYGNDHWADLKGARKGGAEGRLVTAGNPNRYERALEAHRHDTDGRTAMMSGAARLARTSVEAKSAIDQAMIDVAASVVAPVLTAYVIWLFRQADERGLKRLYFLARDAEILMQIARRIAPKLGSTVELRYLYASRLAWNSAVSGPDRNPHVWYSVIYQSATGFTNAELLERAGLSQEEIETITASSRKEWSSTKDRTILRTTLDALHADGTLQRNAEQNKDLVLRYLRQEGLFDGVPHAVVDVGWRGTQHDVLIELQLEQQVSPAYGLFFGLDLSDSKWGHLRSGYYFDARRLQQREPLPSTLPPGVYVPPRLPEALAHEAPRDLYALFEMFCAGREGSLHKYRAEGERIVPVTDELRPREVEAWNLERVFQIVEAFASHLEIDPARAADIDVRAALADVITLLWETPTKMEAEAWGSFPWELGQGSTRRSCDFAPPYDHRFIGRAVGLHTTLATQWPAASLQRSHPVMSTIKNLKSGAAYRQLIRRSKATAKKLLAG